MPFLKESLTRNDNHGFIIRVDLLLGKKKIHTHF